jgi:hypothetical protein
LTVASATAVLALSGRLYTAYWAIANRYRFVHQFAKLIIAASIVACGLVFAHLGYLLAE